MVGEYLYPATDKGKRRIRELKVGVRQKLCYALKIIERAVTVNYDRHVFIFGLRGRFPSIKSLMYL